MRLISLIERNTVKNIGRFNKVTTKNTKSSKKGQNAEQGILNGVDVLRVT